MEAAAKSTDLYRLQALATVTAPHSWTGSTYVVHDHSPCSKPQTVHLSSDPPEPISHSSPRLHAGQVSNPDFAVVGKVRRCDARRATSRLPALAGQGWSTLWSFDTFPKPGDVTEAAVWWC